MMEQNRLIGKSKAIRNLTKLVRNIAARRKDVVISGERGSGRSFVAQNIHHETFNGAGTISCITLKLSLLAESEIDKIVSGAEFSFGGTLVIEDIETVSIHNQAYILRLLERVKKNFNKDGLNDIFTRIIITTNQTTDLPEHRNEILPELANALSDFEKIIVPPLRERKEDIPLLIQHFISEACGEIGIDKPVIDINAVSTLVNQPWNGNIAELKSVIERSVLFSSTGTFTLPQDILDEKTKATRMLENILTGEGSGIGRSLDLIERKLIGSSLKRFNFNTTETADFLGMTEKRLKQRAESLGIM